MKTRCPWVPENDPVYRKYHDEEWGVPLHDDQKLFEFLVLEGFHAGLSWKTILNKRESFREAFDQFDPVKVAQYDDRNIEKLLLDAGIVRNRAKIKAAVNNAQAFLKLQQEFGSFDKYIWSFVNGKPLRNELHKMEDYPAKTQLSDQISKDLKERGFKFVGSTIVYAHMQATGMVNDHSVDCFRYHEVRRLSE